MLSLILLPEDIIDYINTYLTFEQRVILLSCSKYLKFNYLKKIVKLRLNHFDSISFILNNKYRNSILNKIYKKNTEKYICLNLSDRHPKMSFNKRLKNIFSKEHFNKLCNLNILNMRYLYNKYIFINDLLQLFNIQTLILTCDNNSDKKVLIENLEYLHNKNNIKIIIIETVTEDLYKEILICEKDCIRQFIGESYQSYEKEINYKYNSMEEYLFLGNQNFDSLCSHISEDNDYSDDDYYSDDDFIDELMGTIFDGY